MIGNRMLLLAVLALASAHPAGAQVYRYVDANGVIHYTDKPPEGTGAKPVPLPPLQTYKAGAAPPPSAFGSAPAKPAQSESAQAMPSSRFGVTITSPTPEETFRDGSSDLSVAVSVMPGLVDGFGLIYYIDGAAFNREPLMQTSVSVGAMERGVHVFEVALVDRGGKEVARSAPVTVHMKQAVVRPPPATPPPAQP